MRKAKRVGRPTEFKPEYCEQAEGLALLGLKDSEMAQFFKVRESTFNVWKEKHPDFAESLKLGREHADRHVARALYRRALGYSHDAVKIVADAKTGASVKVPYVEHYPPDSTACIFWLKNRQRDKWTNDPETVVNVSQSVTMPPAVVDTARNILREEAGTTTRN